jgi:large repetitive protein
VAIGEIVTYEITIDLPAGLAFENVVVTDRMDKGLAFVDCLLVEVAGSDETGTVCPPTVSSITDPGDLASNPANPGRQVQFNVGDIAAPAANSSLIIRYRVIVLDVIENQETVALNNNATWTWTGGSLSSSAPNVTIVEPDLDIDKSATPTNNVAVGTPIQFTLTISHTAQSSADAFDVVVTDILPAGLEYIPCTVSYIGLAPTSPPPAPAPYCPAPTANLTFIWDSFPLGQSATITFNARLDGSQPTVTNTASVAWSSLPIDPGLGGAPVQLSTHNATSTERLYDPGDPVNVYSVDDSITINAPAAPNPANSPVLPDDLPATGYAPGIVTKLPDQPANKSYAATDVWLEVPSLGISMPIVGVPLVDGEWDVSWLGKQAGWLNGTAYPTWDGNSALTGHVYDANGKPGPFVNIGSLKWGDRILIHYNGYIYVYKVRENLVVRPDDTSPLKHEEDAWLTLITCKTYNRDTNTYSSRVAVRAELVSIEEEKITYTPGGGR